MKQLNVGIIGTGNIAPAYIRGCQPFEVINVKACADLDVVRAQAFAKEHGLTAYSVDELLAQPDIDIVINLTIPAAHAMVSMQIIEAGKHVYSEKPLALNREDGAKILDLAQAKGVRVGCAPDTFLGGGGQTARKVIDDGVIGKPVAATAFFASHGPEGWHPNAGFYYLKGGGPLFDMGPYYLTTLVNLLGPVKRVTASARITFPERIATSKELMGQVLPVEVNTHIAGILDFESGAVATLITSFDVWGAHLPRIEVYGSDGSVSVPDPNRFDGVVQVLHQDDGAWRDVQLTHTTNIGRGSGVADMAYAIISGRPHRASGALAFHVVDVMQALEEASAEGKHIGITSTLDQPLAVPAGLADGVLDE